MKATLKEKWRYITIKVHCEHSFTKEQFERGLTAALLKLVGEIGYSQIIARVITFDKDLAIIRVRRDAIELAKQALPIITNLDNVPVHLQTTYTSGTIRKSKTKAKSSIS